jgi:hypothetical protein
MFNFFKKKNKYPGFRLLSTFYKKDYYFLRNAEWTSVDVENTLVTDPQTLDVVTLTGWGQFIFMAANGEQTIEAFVYFLADQYTEAIPETLDHTIIYALLELEKKKLVLLTNKKQAMPAAFELPGMNGLK